MATPFPTNVDNYKVEGSVVATVPSGVTTLLVTLDGTIAMAAGGTGTFYIHPHDSVDARTFDISGVASGVGTIAFYGLASIGLIWT